MAGTHTILWSNHRPATASTPSTVMCDTLTISGHRPRSAECGTTPQMLMSECKDSGVPWVPMLNTGAANNFCRSPYATTVGVLIVLCPYIRMQLADDDKTLSVMGMCRLKITHHIKLGTSLCAPRVGHNCVYVILGESWLKSHGSISIDIYGFDGYTYRCINFWS